MTADNTSVKAGDSVFVFYRRIKTKWATAATVNKDGTTATTVYGKTVPLAMCFAQTENGWTSDVEIKDNN